MLVFLSRIWMKTRGVDMIRAQKTNRNTVIIMSSHARTCPSVSGLALSVICHYPSVALGVSQPSVALQLHPTPLKIIWESFLTARQVRKHWFILKNIEYCKRFGFVLFIGLCVSLQQASCPEQQHFRLVITSRVTEFDLAHSFLSELQLRPRSSQLLYRQAAMLASSPPPPSSFLSTSHLAYLPFFFFTLTLFIYSP